MLLIDLEIRKACRTDTEKQLICTTVTHVTLPRDITHVAISTASCVIFTSLLILMYTHYCFQMGVLKIVKFQIRVQFRVRFRVRVRFSFFLNTQKVDI